jgi:hypothetical protein
MRREHGRIGGNTVAFGKNDEVAADDVAVAMFSMPSRITKRAGCQTRKLSSTRSVRTLNDGNQTEVAKRPSTTASRRSPEEIDDGRAEEQREHRLAQDLEDTG